MYTRVQDSIRKYDTYKSLCQLICVESFLLSYPSPFPFISNLFHNELTCEKFRSNMTLHLTMRFPVGSQNIYIYIYDNGPKTPNSKGIQNLKREKKVGAKTQKSRESSDMSTDLGENPSYISWQL